MSDSEQELDQEWADDQEDADGDDGDGEGEGDEADGAEASAEGEGAPRRRRRARGNGEPDYLPEDDERAMQALEFVAQVVKEMEMDCRVRLRRPKDDDESPEISIEIAGLGSPTIHPVAPPASP